ncbi:hypothetical protein BJ912DRAFT_992839, partial [Pholiota molesta]
TPLQHTLLHFAFHHFAMGAGSPIYPSSLALFKHFRSHICRSWQTTRIVCTSFGYYTLSVMGRQYVGTRPNWPPVHASACVHKVHYAARLPRRPAL